MSKQRITAQIQSQDPDLGAMYVKKSDLPLEWNGINLGYGTWEITLELPEDWQSIQLLFKNDIIVTAEMP